MRTFIESVLARYRAGQLTAAQAIRLINWATR